MASELDAAPTGRPVGPVVSGGNQLRVAPDKVVAAAKVVAQRADALNAAIMEHGPSLRVEAPAANPVVKAVSDVWNETLVTSDESYLNRAKDYLRGLRKLERQLHAAAERYKVDEDDRAAAFNERDAGQA